jgi:hypothetical protein
MLLTNRPVNRPVNTEGHPSHGDKSRGKQEENEKNKK